MQILKEIAKQNIRFASTIYAGLRRTCVRSSQISKSAEGIFTSIYRSNGFGGKDSVSGPGSDLLQTKIIINELQLLFQEMNIRTMLDIPCGDFNWMKTTDIQCISYIGADIVHELIHKNRERYARHGIRFQHMNIIHDKIPSVDLIFCRDCLVHFSFADIFQALENICSSQSKYFLTTTFTERQDNNDIETGGWRPINLELAPFRLATPLKIINEGCTEDNGAYADKALGLWRVADLRESLSKRSTTV